MSQVDRFFFPFLDFHLYQMSTMNGQFLLNQYFLQLSIFQAITIENSSAKIFEILISKVSLFFTSNTISKQFDFTR